MTVATGVTVEEYLGTAYRPDCDYVDGEVLDRNVGEYSHSSVQAILLFLLMQASPDLELRVKPELRIRVSSTRYRVPDILVERLDQVPESVLTTPPLLCIEIVSPDDRFAEMAARVDDCLAFGVDCVWVIDPYTRNAWQHDRSGSRMVKGRLETSNPEIAVNLEDVFARLDRRLSKRS